MRLPRPSPALVIACIALLLAAGGASYAAVKATGSAVNVVDPTNAAQIAKVDASGKLLVGDGAGPLSVDGTVSARPWVPSSPFRATIEASPGTVRRRSSGRRHPPSTSPPSISPVFRPCPLDRRRSSSFRRGRSPALRAT